MAYAPVGLNGLNYVIVAKISSAEAFAPVDVFTRNLVLSMACIIVVVTLLSLLLAQVFVRPVRRLQGAVNRVSSGEIGVEIPVRAGDEFGDLGSSFNDMSRSLKLKQDLLDEQKKEYDRCSSASCPPTWRSGTRTAWRPSRPTTRTSR